MITVSIETRKRGMSGSSLLNNEIGLYLESQYIWADFYESQRVPDLVFCSCPIRWFSDTNRTTIVVMVLVFD